MTKLNELPAEWGWAGSCGADRTVDHLAKRVRVLENMVRDLLTLLDEDGTLEHTRVTTKGHVREEDE